MHRRSLLAAALGAVPIVAAWGQDYPSRPVRVIVGFPPGGGTDLVARPMAQGAQVPLGQSLVIDNRGGANGSVGLEAVAKSAPDGYTIGHVNSSVVLTNPLLYRNLTVNVERDLAPICTVADSAVVLAVPADLPAKDLREFVALAKSKPGELHFGSGRTGKRRSPQLRGIAPPNRCRLHACALSRRRAGAERHARRAHPAHDVELRHV